MKAHKVIHRCQQCGYTSHQWLGRCPDCGGWNSFAEETVAIEPVRKRPQPPGVGAPPEPITQVAIREHPRVSTGFGELDRVMGGGIVPGSIVLIGGEPGIGKSTILLQTSDCLSRNHGTVLLVTGEESPAQVRMRAERLGGMTDNLLVLAETDINRIEAEIESVRPVAVIIDSIQTMYDPEITSSPGSVNQVKECTQHLIRVSKPSEIPVFLVGHVTKEGAIAGPRVLEHMVDTVLYFEGDRHQSYRIIRAVKNRFGPTDEIGVFEMSDGGLTEVSNPSEVFLAGRGGGVSGLAVVASLEGTRSFLVELQALVSGSNLAYPRRVAAGLDYQRLSIIIAVLERRAGVRLHDQDVYVSAAGGLKIVEPAVDLGVALAIASAAADTELEPETAVFGEVGLSGEIRYVAQAEKRLKEAAKLGFKKAMIPAGAVKGKTPGIQVVQVRTLAESIKHALPAS